jgi:hypothetical protein
MAEISWEDQSGIPKRLPATLEDTSSSGACLRLKAPIQVGARLVVRWHREQFSAVARNCRRDGREFLLGVKREPESPPRGKEGELAPQHATAAAESVVKPPLQSASSFQDLRTLDRVTATRTAAIAATPTSVDAPKLERPVTASTNRPPFGLGTEPVRPSISSLALPGQNSPRPKANSTSRHERNTMPAKRAFSKFWRRPAEGGAPNMTAPTEVSVNKPGAILAEPASVPQGELLSHDDIYHAAGILNPPSGYGIQKVVDMLNNERIRDLAKEVKRASVLMALDVAGIPIDDVLRDATRRQQALNSYEAGQRRQLEEFEAHKIRENSQIETEMERVKAHYAERIQRNQEQVEREKATLRNWQMAMQHESQRISEVIELCQKQPAVLGAGAPPVSSAQDSNVAEVSAQKASAAKA